MNKENSVIDSLFEDIKDIYNKKYFEFKSLKLFSDSEILCDSKRKYRNVFQGPEVDYIYGEFSFYNLAYLKLDWNMDITYKLFSANKELLTEFTFNSKVSKNEPVHRTVRGFGDNIAGNYWKRGIYKLEVFIADKRVASDIIYIEDLGFAGDNGVPYMMLEEVKLFDNSWILSDADEKTEKVNEAETEDKTGITKKVYCKCFLYDSENSVDVVLSARNLMSNSCSWYGEFIFLFKTELGELKEEIKKVAVIRSSDVNISVDAFGKNEFEYFSEGMYYVEVIFNEKLIARVPFKIGEEEIRSTVEDHRVFFPDVKTYFDIKKTEEEILRNLDELIGLEEVKKTVNDQMTYLKYLNLKQSRGISKKEYINLHSLFIGNPGTGKTVVAKMLGKIYKDSGLLSSGHVYEVGRPELVAEYIGHTALKVEQAIEKARGGVLFIDEAYSLAREKGDKRDFGAEVIEVLIKEMSDGPGDISIIAAGYSEEMNIFLESNPGLKSRFKHTFIFNDYSPDELLQIAEYYAGKKNLTITSQAKERLNKIIIKEWRSRDNTFGNARLVNEIIDKAEMNLSLRVMNYPDPFKCLPHFVTALYPWDFDNVISSSSKPSPVSLPVDEEGLSDAMKELNSLTGLDGVKADVAKLTKLIRYYKEEDKNPLSMLSLHSVFTGNPGTGKTTVARIMAKIFCSLGILERGHLVECSRESLVSGYTGQTAIKTAKMIEKAIGGVLFIDEAYSLASSNDNDFGKEVIETLLKKMEDRRGEFIVIAAGYTEQMQYFLDSNPGLRSRFDRVMEFPDYSEDELIKIAYELLKINNIEIYSIIVSLDFGDFLSEFFKNRGRNFANAREVRKLIEQIAINQNLRVSEIPKTERTKDIIRNLESEDFLSIIPDSGPSRHPLGFA